MDSERNVPGFNARTLESTIVTLPNEVKVWVSTVRLSDPDGKYTHETMIFAGYEEGPSIWAKGYLCEEEAKVGHLKVIRDLRNGELEGFTFDGGK